MQQVSSFSEQLKNFLLFLTAQWAFCVLNAETKVGFMNTNNHMHSIFGMRSNIFKRFFFFLLKINENISLHLNEWNFISMENIVECLKCFFVLEHKIEIKLLSA